MATNNQAPKELQKKLNKELNDFLKQYQGCKAQAYTNTSMGNTPKSYNIPEYEYDNFLSLYTKCARAGVELHFTEKPTEISQLRVDLDFRFENKNIQTEKQILNEIEVEHIMHKYKPQHIKAVVQEYFRILNDNFDIDAESQVAFVHEKPYATLDREQIKDGIHIIFPYINMSYELQHFVRAEMLKSKVFEDIGFIKKLEDVIDKAIIDKNCWLLYVSKKIESYVYTVSRKYVYDRSTQEVDKHELDNSIEDYVKLFSMRRPNCQQNVLISNNDVHAFIENWNKAATKKSVVKPNKLIDLSFACKQDIQLAKELVKCLSESRAEKYDDWSNLGWTLHNISDSEEILAVWDKFSKNGSSYRSGECDKLWCKMRTEKQGMATLKYWAKLDNPEMYAKVMENSIIN
jgi:hypothetical protein